MTDLNMSNSFHLRNIVEKDNDSADEISPLTEPPAPSGNTQDSTTNTTQRERVSWVVARCSIIASLASLLAGMSGGFTSPALQELSDKNLTIPTQHFNSSSILPSVFGALELAGTMFGGVLAWPISNGLGRQPALTVGGIPFLCGWLLISYSIQITGSRAAFLTVILAGRFLIGIASGWSIFCVSLFIAEIASPKWKGFFCNFNTLFYTLGILLTYFFGIKFGDFQFSYSDIALVGVGISILFEFLMLVATYESPRWLFSKNMDYNGTRILKILRGKQFQVTKETNQIKRKLKKNIYSMKKQLSAFKHRAVYHPFILVILVAFFEEFSGNTAVLYYSSQIFSQAGYSHEKAQLATFGAVGVVKLVATIVSTILVDYVGKRVLLIVSSTGIVISCSLLGVYFLIFEDKCNSSLHFPGCPNGLEYLAISCIVIFIASHSIGWSPLTWILAVELLPNHIRALGGSIGNACLWTFAFIIALSFHPYTAVVTPKFTWWTFALITAVSIVFVILFIPETKGHSLEEIQEHFEKGKIIVCSCSCAQCTPKKAPHNSN